MRRWLTALLGQRESVERAALSEEQVMADRLDALLDVTADAILGVDGQGRIGLTNLQAERLFGYSREELEGTAIETLLPDVFEAGNLGRRTLFLNDPMTRPVEGGSDLQGRRKDGSEFPAAVGVSGLRREEVVAIFLITDLTEIVAAEQALLESREEFLAVVESAPDAMAIFDGSGEIRLVNAQTEELFGWERNDLLGQSIEMLIPKSSLPAGPGGNAVELVAQRKDGGEFPAEARFGELKTRDGLLTASSIRDVSERHLLEARLHEAQKMEAIGRLAGGVAHDFNNLLGVILGYGEILSETEKHLDGLEEIVGAARRAASLTRQLLAFSRRQVLEPRILNLNPIVQDAEKLLRRLIGAHVDLRITCAEDLWQVKADPSQIEQIVMNLAVNARDAMPSGGKLTFETSNVAPGATRTEPAADAGPGGYVLLAVADTGTGMDEETKAHIFEPFFSTKAEGRGTGLGLATVYGIVKQSGGWIRVLSEPDQGATFEIFLPRSDEEGAETGKAQGIEPVGETPPAAVDEEEASAQGRTILVVEDQAPLREMIREVLCAKGYVVLEAESGREALRESDSHEAEIDLLLTDIVMPEMNGRDLATRMAGTQDGLKVLYMSGYASQKADLDGAIEPGDAYLEKPFSPKDLLRRVRQVLAEASP